MRAAQTVPGSIHKRKRCLCPQLVISLLANPAGSRPEALEIFWRLKPAIQWLLCRITHHVTEFKKATIGVYQRKWHPTPVLLPGKSHGQRSLVGCSPWGREESDTTERLHSHFSLSCIGEGNGNPLQCSCLENPRDGEPGGLPSVESHRVGHDWSDLAAAANIYLEEIDFIFVFYKWTFLL